MMTDLIEYRARLAQKLQAVDVILSDMGATPPTKPEVGARMSASAKAKISAAKKAWWASKRKAGGK